MADTMESAETVTTTDKEPVKNEESTTSTSNNDERNDDANSPPPNCSICLGKLVNTSFTDSCLHQFCFTCLLQWSRIKTECPLCKQTFKSIIHNVRSEEDYDQYHVPRELVQPLPPPLPIPLHSNVGDPMNFFDQSLPREMRRFAYRTTMVPNRILETRSSAAQSSRLEPVLNISPTLSREERRFRRIHPITYRRNIYRTHERSNYVPDIYSRFRESSAEYYQRHPHELERLAPWINRELTTLLDAHESHVVYVSRVVMDALIRYDIRSPEFSDAIHLYLTIHTRLFIHELMNFCRSELSISDHNAVTYGTTHSVQGLSGGYWTRVQSPISTSSTNSSSTDDSDVRVVDHVDTTNFEIPRMNNDFVSLPSVYSELNMPGPSTVSETFHINANNTNANINNEIHTGSGVIRSPCVLIISSSSSSDSDECEVVGYVKPRHERTPEIIELISSDDEGIVSNDNIDDLESTPKNISIIAINDDIPCTSNASNNNERTDMSNNQTPKTNSKLYDLVTGTLSSSESTFDNGSDSDSDFVLRPSQKRRNSRRNTKRGKGNGGKKIERKNSKKSPRKRSKNSTSNSIDVKRDNKRRRNLNNSAGDNNKTGKNTRKVFSGSSNDENNIEKDVDNGEWHMLKNTSTNECKRNSRSSSTSSDNSSSSNTSTTSTSTNSTSTTNTSIYGSTTSLNSINNTNNHSKNDKTRKKKNCPRNNKVNKSKNNSKQSDNKNDHSKSKKSTKSKLKSTVIKLQRPVNSTLLRKDIDKKEWYIDNNRQSRSRSRSKSSYESQRDSSSRRYRRHHRHRSMSNNSGKDNTHEKNSESKIHSERLKKQSLYSNTNSQNEDVNDNNDNGTKVHHYEHSNSQSSTMSDKYSNSNENDDHNAKYNSKRKNIKEDKNTNGGQLLDDASTSTSLIQKYFNAKNSSSSDKKRNYNTGNDCKSQKKKDENSKRKRISLPSKSKSKQNKRRRRLSSSSSSSSFLSTSSYSSSSSN